MAQGVEIKGLDHLIKKVKNLSYVIKDEVDAECEAGAYEMNAEASANISRDGLVDNGELLASQQVISDRPNHKYTVQNVAFYAPFQEFGTGARFSANSEWQAIAAQFKGMQNGNFDVFLQKIKEWCNRKGIDEEEAYVICRKILENGLRPRPFLQPAFYYVSPLIVKRIKAVIKQALSA